MNGAITYGKNGSIKQKDASHTALGTGRHSEFLGRQEKRIGAYTRWMHPTRRWREYRAKTMNYDWQ
jgi:hypothetical protein